MVRERQRTDEERRELPVFYKIITKNLYALKNGREIPLLTKLCFEVKEVERNAFIYNKVLLE